jgi:hypothetical protein
VSGCHLNLFANSRGVMPPRDECGIEAFQSTPEGTHRFEKAGILSATTVGRQRGQVYEAKEVIAAFTSLIH